MPRSPESQKLMTRPGMTFDVSTAGRSGDPLVLMLHGFCASRYSYDTAITDLACHGYYAVAPNQRGYSPGARPDPSHYPSYRVELLVGDAMEIAGVLGYTERRFHLVGHDWGASLAWEIAARYPERLASLTILSRPHPLAFNRALETDTEQAKKSGHHGRFLDPNAASEILAEDAKWMRTRLSNNGVPPNAIAKHVAVLGNPEAMEAALAWYRARGTYHSPVGRIQVPTLYIWGTADDTVGRAAAEGTRDFIDGPFQFAPLEGVGHFAADQSPEVVSVLIRSHVIRFERGEPFPP
jgi:pimeloyl-ACP methyl ester carboxylesterase